jgi:hypothetical protein
MRESAHQLGEFPNGLGPIHLIGEPESGMLCLGENDERNTAAIKFLA